MLLPDILCYIADMKLETIDHRPTYTKPVPAFSFLFAYGQPSAPRATSRKPAWLKRPALRTKRV